MGRLQFRKLNTGFNKNRKFARKH